MPRIRRRAHVQYTAQQMFDLVNDVEAYPKFLHWCSGARVESVDESHIEATVDIGIAGFHKSFRTRNTLERPKRITIALVSGPFSRLDGAWAFTDSPSGGADIELSLDYEISHSPLGFVLGKAFEEVARSQMSAFVRRADEVYG
jgi:ribosome-associated toxin RatA of RatAB toxin-antitoxin module